MMVFGGLDIWRDYCCNGDPGRPRTGLLALSGCCKPGQTEAHQDGGGGFGNDGDNPDGMVEGWIAIIPEPSSALLIAFGMACVASRRRT